jgi:ribonuclease HII
VSTGGPPDREAKLALAEVRARLVEADPEVEARWVPWLRRDARRGAQALADGIERRREKRAAERARVEALFAYRAWLFERGARRVAGVDEVGVGPLAGPVVAAAVVLPETVTLPGLNDSKKLRPEERERLDAEIRAQALAIAIGEATSEEVDRVNILQATLLAMQRAVAGLEAQPDHVLVDARTIPGVTIAQTSIVGGDARDGSIAAASIVAKVYRDACMRRLDTRYPGYGFARHKGYGTEDHLNALARLGPSREHRRSFAPVAQSTAS